MSSKRKLEPITINEGDEFDFADNDQILTSEHIGGGTWGLVIMRAIGEDDSGRSDS